MANYKYNKTLKELKYIKQHYLYLLNMYCYDKDKRDKIYNDLKDVNNTIDRVSFKLNLERTIKNERKK